LPDIVNSNLTNPRRAANLFFAQLEDTKEIKKIEKRLTPASPPHLKAQ